MTRVSREKYEGMSWVARKSVWGGFGKGRDSSALQSKRFGGKIGALTVRIILEDQNAILLADLEDLQLAFHRGGTTGRVGAHGYGALDKGGTAPRRVS
jgi:hypothetical protein